jgi:1,2-diacylglycerol 3-alpha-glucosyltransferase
MKILLVNSSAYPEIGGVENSLRFIGRELLRTGHEVKIFCFQNSTEQPLRTEHEGIEIIRCPYSPSQWPHLRMRYQVDLVRRAIQPILSEYHPNAVWSRSASVGLGVLHSGYKGRIVHILPVTARLDAASLFLKTNGMSWKRRLFLLGLWPFHYFVASSIERNLLKSVQPVVFSDNMRKEIRQSYGRSIYENCVKIYPGVDTNIFSPQMGKTFFPEIERKFGIYEGEHNILFVGRFSAMKNLYSLLDAFAKLRSSCRLILLGSGTEEQRLKKTVEKRGLNQKVIFPGQQSELLPGFYSMARVFVNPSVIEPFGQTFIEAQACGTPVVGYGGNPRYFRTATNEIINNSKSGVVVKQPGASVLAEKIDSILSLDNDAYAAMSQQAMEDVREHFAWRKFVESLLALSTKRSVTDRL